MSEKIYNVLFLCTGNSARSIIAEVLLNAVGKGRFKAYSAGSDPRGEVNPMTLEVLQAEGYDTGGLSSKPWDVFARPGAPVMDFVFTVCDQAAGEVCPVWPGQPVTAHWSFADPAAVEGERLDRLRAFRQAHAQILNRVRALASLPIEKLDRLALMRQVREIGQSRASAEA